MRWIVRLNELLRRGRIRFANALRRRRLVPRYIVLSLSGEIQELPPSRPDFPLANWLFPASPITVSGLRALLEQIAGDSRIEGVVLRIDHSASPAVHQSLRQEVLDFRARGKRAIAYAKAFGPFQYYVATACDQIIMPPSAEWAVLGLRREYVFLKDALDRLGVHVDVFNVSPFKSAGDPFTRTDFSEESRAQAEWLLDENWREVLRGIAEGRRLSETRAQELIDAAPLSAQEAVEAGLLDAALYEDELEHFLQSLPTGQVASLGARTKSRRSAPPTLGLHDECRKAILIPEKRDQIGDKIIAVVGIEGMIVEGHSQSLPFPIPIPLPFGEQLAGAESIAQAVRRAERNDDIAAVIVHVDSGGGSALASDLIAREIKRLRNKKPVVVYMSGAAASGGYYVSAPANVIIAQPLTLTGSIGVIALRPNAAGVDERLGLRRTVLRRGARAGLLGLSTPLNDDERNAALRSLNRFYADFKRVVMQGRALTEEELEPVAGGRVWSGRQALQHKLVDELGNFRRAIEKACELAGLPREPQPRIALLVPPRKPALPLAFSAWMAGAVRPSTDAGLHGGSWLHALFSRWQVWAIWPWWARTLD
ncbi:MAG: signal peptide peptidase SppA [Anaerolineae bacterium]|nr:signal peptide peptidase SppA [Thermoflexales bacterium]MDW8407990.1 signal peptide peptidase SppA [Anaerolineae bacterium]